jgi:hypothetical protein
LAQFLGALGLVKAAVLITCDLICKLSELWSKFVTMRRLEKNTSNKQVKFFLDQAMKAQRGSRGIALLFL